jgi:hypothetical protein
MKIKEVYIGVVPRPGDKGELVAGRIMFNGIPINKGIYDADHVPPGFTWDEGPKSFCKKARQHDGHGLTVIYEGQEIPGVKAVIDKSIAADDKLLQDRAKPAAKPPKEVKRDDH